MLEKPHVDEAFFDIFAIRTLHASDQLHKGWVRRLYFWIRKIRFLHTRYAIVM
jgi:hypothetical protein